MELSGMPPEVADRMREDHRRMDKTQLEKIKQMFGDFDSYSVQSVKSSPVTEADLQPVNMPDSKEFSAGTHTVIICKAKFSRASGRFGFELIKKTPESEYLYEAYRFEAQ